MDQQDLQYAWFKRKFHEFSGIQLESYKDSQMRRRIAAFMTSKGAKNYVEFLKKLTADEKAAEDFRNFLTINVSSFFRDAAKWSELEAALLPDMLKTHKALKLWSAGCSIGCEPYTMAILCEELKRVLPFGYTIYATDIDDGALKKAKEGCYAADMVREVPERSLKAYFINEDDKKFKVKDTVKKNVHFQSLDLLEGDFKVNFHLIACRNVVIYFDESAKQKLYGRFCGALVKGGILFTGGSEIIFQCEQLGLKNISMSFYRKE